MNTLLVLLVLIGITTADVSHLASSQYLTPNQQEQRSRLPSNELIVTTIEKHEVIELPTQIEIVKDGQSIYGVPPISKVEFARMSPMTEIGKRNMQPSLEIRNLQPPQSYGVPYEEPMKSYLPPVFPETTTTEMPITTSEIPTTTTEMPVSSTTSMVEEEITTEQPSSLTMNTPEHIIEVTTIPTLISNYLHPILANNHYLPPTPMLANQYIPPIIGQNQHVTPNIPQEKYLPPSLAQNRNLTTATSVNQKLLPFIPEKISMKFQVSQIQYLPPAMSKFQHLPPVMPADRSRVLENQYLTPTMLKERSLPAPKTQNLILPSTMLENQYFPVTMPENPNLPPVDMMLPPPPPMPQPTYQQYQEQLLRNHHQMSRKYLINPISQMEEQHADSMEPQKAQMQPVVPVEPAHSLSDEGYHYKTGEEDLSHFRFRH